MSNKGNGRRGLPHLRGLAPAAMWTDAEIQRWPDAGAVLAGILEQLQRWPYACTHLFADAAVGQPIIAYVCAQHGDLLCDDCHQTHMTEDDMALGCLIPSCTMPHELSPPATWDLDVELMPLMKEASGVSTIAEAVGMRVSAPLCRAHGGGRVWRNPNRIRFLTGGQAAS